MTDQPTAGVVLKPSQVAACDFINALYGSLGPLAPEKFSREEQHAIFVLSAYIERAPTPASGAGEANVERMSRVYAEATGYYVQFHRGLSSPSSADIRKGIRAVLAALTSEPKAEGEAVGLLRRWMDARTYSQRITAHAETHAFLSSQTEGR